MPNDITATNLQTLKIDPVVLKLVAAAPSAAPPPPAAGVAMKAAVAALVPLSAADLKMLPPASATQAIPAQAVAGVAQQAAAAAAMVWENGKTITNQWTINQDRNSWIGVAGIGWQKLSTASDSGCIALTMLSSNALVSKASVNYRTDGTVHEIYVW